MRISVVIPVYNVEKYIRECLDSVLNQTQSAYEIILVNDGSTDNSGKICDEYAKKYDNIVVTHKKNAGLGYARNTGLEYVHGDYVAFLDSDDFWDLDFIKKICEIFEKTGCDTCKTSFKRVGIDSQILSEHKIIPGKFKEEKVKTEFLPRIIGSAPDKKDAIPMSVWGTIYSMDIIRKNNLEFVSEREYISEDIMFNIEYFSYSNYTVLSSYIGYNYRYTPGSLTLKYMPERFERVKVLYEKEKEVLKEKDLYNTCKYRPDRAFFVNLRVCFEQLNPKGSKLKKSEILKEISNICNDKLVRQVIINYPRKKLGISQRIFLELILCRMKSVLYLYFCVR